ncbi:AraC family transcriptional regulator [Caulobacter sp. Root487D2Y]|uniref:SDR family NAD(P)-dependent oxidoreductase n=1 Tax=Caulobacter sp. Root487D2Y TaxID=1736547 RepID=UPI0006F9B100|nr:SDR family oxidoreductase [Caulobacter sp. Root487D2Y]KQY27430.1 AraC family transcriptional regulator [Caulobacter sp. Root487D2Y]
MSKQDLRGAALITGASSGIGATYADRLARAGHDLVLVARDAARLEALAAKLKAATGVKIDIVAADLTDRTDLAKVEARLADDASIDILINNAGAALAGSFAEQDVERVENMIQLNVVSVTRLAHAAAKAFAARDRGAIVNISSVVGLAPELQSVVYGATKAYVTYFTQALRQQLSPGVQLQAVLPGATRTEIWDRSGGGGADKLDPNMLMEVDDLVDAALAGFRQGELVTIPSLPDPVDFAAYDAARAKLLPNLSRNRPAERYRAGAPA